MTAEKYRNYLEQDFSDVDINEMTDLRMIKADRNKSLQERRDIFLNKVGNLRKRNDRNPGGIDEKLCSRYGRYFGCRSL